jgi:hypothetical protein
VRSVHVGEKEVRSLPIVGSIASGEPCGCCWLLAIPFLRHRGNPGGMQ